MAVAEVIERLLEMVHAGIDALQHGHHTGHGISREEQGDFW